ncbi:MAG: hypothetical protein JKY04_06150 [Sneathiella sp.]|nr:hypothetical protein [Sneathiella sp.]
MMNKLLFTAHWTADEAAIILSFIDELREVILAGYEVEIQEVHRLKNKSTEVQGPVDGFNDRIPF